MAGRDTEQDPIEPNDEIEQGERTDEQSRVVTPATPGHTAPSAQHLQHDRKGQAQSPREIPHDEQPKKKEGH